MNAPLKQHLIDPEICIRCYTCEEACPIDAITHDDNNVVVDASICNQCMDCISPCPTGSIDNWRVVATPYSLEEQFEWEELPEQEEIVSSTASTDTSLDALDDEVAALLAEAHKGAGGKAKAPDSASKPTVNLFNGGKPATATVQGNYRLTDKNCDSDVRHIILDLGSISFPVLEGQSIGVIPPGLNDQGKPHWQRLYSISSPRNGERPNFNNLSLTVKREDQGLCSNYVCDLKPGDEVQITGPFGATFLMPNAPEKKLLMICTGTGSAPFRAMTMNRQRYAPDSRNSMTLVFGARSPEDLPYFGPLAKVPDSFLEKHFAFSRVAGQAKEYVQDKLRQNSAAIAALMGDPSAHIYICGLKAMEQGVDEAMSDIARGAGSEWHTIRDQMRDEGRYHVETY
jgi:benzoyl-CoA 2,3-dioxygenase component A